RLSLVEIEGKTPPPSGTTSWRRPSSPPAQARCGEPTTWPVPVRPAQKQCAARRKQFPDRRRCTKSPPKYRPRKTTKRTTAGNSDQPSAPAAEEPPARPLCSRLLNSSRQLMWGLKIEFDSRRQTFRQS